MAKDFDNWNGLKKRLNSGTSKVFYCEREIWWCSFGINIGFEQDGTGKNFDRPVAIIRGFNQRLFLGVALTSQNKQGKFYFPLGKIAETDAFAILSQVRIFDTKRLVRKISTLDSQTFEQLRLAIKTIIFP